MSLHYYALEKLINLYDGYQKLLKIDEHNLLLLQIEGERYLLESMCPHRGHPLSESDIHTEWLRCPLHGYRFAIPSGQLIDYSEELCRNLKTYEVVVEGRELGVWL